MSQHIIVSEYNPEWQIKYEQEKQKIISILRENCTAVHHIGSTSVPGLAAKPVIDILAVVRSLKKTGSETGEKEIWRSENTGSRTAGK